MDNAHKEKVIFILSILNVAISAIVAYLQKEQVDEASDK